MRVAIIGCGAVAEMFHLPTLAQAGVLDNAVLIDKSINRASALAAKYGISKVASNYEEVLTEFDAAILATPHPLHASIAIGCLAANKPVLCEKPLCVTQAEAQAMISASAASKTLLAVGLMRRQGPAFQEAARILHDEELGRPLRFDFREGGLLCWPISSPGFWRKETVGGGVLLDTGPHTLDLLTWWLGDWKHVEYRDDNLGNVEANCQLALTLKNGAVGTVELSRTHNPGQFYRVECEHGWLEAVPHQFNLLRIYDGSTGRYEERQTFPRLKRGIPLPFTVNYPWLFKAQWVAFTDAVQGEPAHSVTALECLAVTRLIEVCYQTRKSIAMPWIHCVRQEC